MKRWWLAIALLLSLGVNLGLLAVMAVHRLRPPAPPGPPSPAVGAGIQRLADHLGLEGESRRRFMELQRQFVLRTRTGRLRMDRLHRQLRAELTRAQPDRRRVESLVEESTRTYAELERAMAEVILESREILTPRQQQQYLRFVARLRAAAGDGPRPPIRRPGPPRRPPPAGGPPVDPGPP